MPRTTGHRHPPAPPAGADRGRGRPTRACRVAAALIVASCVLGTAVPLAGQELQTEIQAAEARLDAARTAGLHIIAPRHFRRAAEKLQEARDRYAGGGEISRVRRALEEARNALAEAERLKEVGTALFAGALEARQGALAADAPRLAPRAWEEAEREARDAGSALEGGDRGGAAERASRAAATYRRAELEAIRTDVLGRAREARTDALGVRADELAPRTFTAGETVLDSANRLLESDRTRLSEAARLGEEAASAFHRATRIATAADSVRRRQLSVEEVTLRHEEEVARVAERLQFEPDLSAGIAPVVEEIVAAIRSLQEDRSNLQGTLAEREEEVESLRAEIDSLQARLAGLEQREARITAELRERRRREEKMREVRAIFSPEEGEVVIRGDSLAIRLYGLTFASGKAELRPEHFSLLTRVQRVMREFPEAPVTVEGHTDSRGNDEFNRALSQRRAIAVREYLLANMPISAERISAVGYGEDRPIATNDTEEGRTKNRRIEVILDVSGG